MLAALGAAPLAACATRPPVQPAAGDPYAGWHIGEMPDHPFNIPLVDRSRLPPEMARQTVPYHGSERPGTIVVDIDQRHLFLVQEGHQAIRYGIGVGRQGFSWRGAATVGRKAAWPGWTPTATMVNLGRAQAGRYEGGLNNPLGARALYLHQKGRDTMFRIHGTNEPWSIGKEGSSGCVRLLNEDIVDLYDRVPVGTTVLVRRNGRWRA